MQNINGNKAPEVIQVGDLTLDSTKFNEKEAEKYLYSGRVYQNGLGTKADLREAVSMYEKAATFGSAEALYRLGNIFSEDENDEVKAFPYYRAGAILGNVEAQYKAGRAYLRGIGVAENAHLAEEFLSHATFFGMPDAQLELGNLYKDTLHDYEKALRWFQAAHKQGKVFATFQLGTLYEDGLGVAQDWNKAKDLYLDAYIEGRLPAALYRLGYLYEIGNEDFPVDTAEAMMWYDEAVKMGVEEALPRLQKLKEKGSLKE